MLKIRTGVAKMNIDTDKSGLQTTKATPTYEDPLYVSAPKLLF